MTETMQAAVTVDGGLQELRDVPRPSILATEVLIEVGAAGVNPVDWKTADGLGSSGNFDPDAPMILGWDVAGTVVQKGPGVTRFEVGDRVFGMPRFPRPANAYAEYVVAGSREVAKTPDGMTDIEAAGAPLAALTAWQALVDTMDVTDGDRVLINAASGGVGHLALQIAKARGAEVWATASTSKQQVLHDLGADHVIDHHNERFEDVVGDLDAVLDLHAGNDSPTRAVSVLRRGGRLVIIARPDQLPSAEVLDDAGVVGSWMLVEPDHTALERMAALMAEGSLRVVIGDTRPLDRVGELHEIGRAGGPLGKLVATVNPR